MIDRQQIQDRQPRGECPSDAALGMFDSGTLSSSEAERISDHVVNCKRCRGPFKDQHREETRLLAEIFTPGRALLAEPEFEQARRTLLERPEPVCAAQVEEAETSLSPRGLPRHDHVPSKVGPYRLRYELGRGAMGIVYRARHANLKRDASLKILHPQLVEDHEMVERFYGEMEAFGQLRDPHIVQAYDAGESAGVHFLAMEYVDGADASKLCAYAGRLNTPDACQIVRQAALGLETARRHNMVHRDIKPSNLMVARNGQVKILDLGLASFRKEGVESFHDDAVGTVDYMAPEQWKGSSRIDIRADIYSLGCTLFKLLTGHPPFYDAPDDGVSKMQAHLTQAAPTLREIRRELPRELETLVNRMLAKRASDRLSSPQEIAALLEPFCVDSDLAGLVERHVPADTLAPSGSVEPSDTMATGKSKTFAERKRRRWTRWAVCATVVGVLAILATVVVRITGEGTVVVAVNQPGATIQIGSELISTDKAGQSVLVNIGRGQHTVKVTKEGFETRVEIVEVRPNRETSIDITLTPQQITAQRPRTLVGHKGPVHAVDISPDGKWVLTGGKDRSVRLWSVASGNEQLQMLGHEDVVWDVAFGPESKYAVSCSLDKTARMWDLKTGEEFQRFNGHKDAVLCVALSGEGTQLLTGSKDGTVRTWDTTTGQPQGIMTGHRGWVRAVTFLPDSRYAVSCGHDLVAILWDLETGSMRKVLQGHTRPLSGISASVDGQHVVTCSWDSTVRLWNVHTEQELNVMRLHGGPVRSVTFLATNNHVISASEDYDLRLWNPFSGECVREYNGHSGKVFDVAVNSTAGLVVSASADCTARIWKLPELKDKPGVDALSQRPPEPLIGETAVAVKPIRKWEASEQALQSVAIISDGKLVASGGDDGVVRVWETDSGKLQRELTDATDSNLCVRFSPNGHLLAAGGKDHRIYLWNMSDESPAKTLVGHKGWVTGIAFLSNSQRLLSGSFDTTSRIWDVKKAKPLLAFPGRIQWIRSVDVGQNPQGALRILGGNAGCLQIWTVANGRAMGRLLGVPYQSPAIACIAISPNGRLVADAGWSHGVRIRNMMKGQLVNQFDCHGGTVYDVLWYGDNRRILTACADGTLRLWDRRSRRELKRYVGHVGAVRSVSLSADAKLIVSAGEDGMVCVWPAEGIASPLGRPNNKPVASQGATQK